MSPFNYCCSSQRDASERKLNVFRVFFPTFPAGVSANPHYAVNVLCLKSLIKHTAMLWINYECNKIEIKSSTLTLAEWKSSAKVGSSPNNI